MKKLVLTTIVFLTLLLSLKGQNWIQQGTNLIGESSDDEFGSSVSISSDGNVVAVSGEFNDASGSDAGHVRVYSWDGSTWIQRGLDIDGEAAGDRSGKSISLSSDGTKLAIGAINNDGIGSSAGHVRVFEWNGSVWTQLGSDIDGETSGSQSGWSVSLSSDGITVAIGGINNSGSASQAGHTRIFEWNGTMWLQKGLDIDGEAATDRSGWSVSLSANGDKVAISSVLNDGNGSSSGHVRVYEWSGSVWQQQGTDIDGEAASDQSGYSISLSGDGTTLAIGATFNDGGANNSGHVRIYEWSGSAWTQLGSDIEGEGSFDLFGWSVSISSDGETVAAGSYSNKDGGLQAGHVRIFDWNVSDWVQRGTDIDGSAKDRLGSSVSLTPDGSRVLIGATEDDGSNTLVGHARVYYFDDISPTVSITSTTSSPFNTLTFPVTFTLSEDDTNFGVDDVTVTNGTIDGFTGSGVSYSAIITPLLEGLVSVDVAGASFTDAAGNNNTTATTLQLTYDDVTPPTIIVSSTTNSPFSDATFPVSFLLSEGASDFTDADVTISNGTLSVFSGSGVSYSATITPISEGDVTVSVAGANFTDPAGNNNTVSNSLILNYDITPPSVVISTSTTSPFSDTTFPVTFTISENNTGFVEADITVTNGTLSAFSGSGTSFSAIITPTVEGAVLIDILSATFADEGGLNNTAATTLSLTYDITPPSITIASTTSSPFNTATFPVAFTLSESSTDFVESDIEITNGKLSDFSGSGSSYTGTITPLSEGNVLIDVPESVFTDAGGLNNTAATTLSLTYDNTPPIIIIATTTDSPFNDATFPITFTLSETTADFDDTDVDVTNGVLSGFTGSGVSYTATITPSSDGTVSIDVAGMKFTDGAGNNNIVATTLSLVYDSTPPTITISSTTISPFSSITFPITFIISESVNDFSEIDVNVTNGTLSNFTGSGTSYSATIAPTAEGMVSIDVSGATFSDAVGLDNIPAITLDMYYFEFEGWIQQGTDLDGTATQDEFGTSVSLSNDGNTMAIGAPKNNQAEPDMGLIKIFTWDGSSWIQRGADINGDMVGADDFGFISGDQTGRQVSLSGNGNKVAVSGGYSEDIDFLTGNDGRVRVYEWNGSAWTKQGADILAEAGGDEMGSSISMSTDGNTLATGARLNDGTGTNAGHARIFSWSGTMWVQKGGDLDAEAGGDEFGNSIDLSSDGNIVAVSAPLNSGNGAFSGHVRVFVWNGSAWNQRGLDIEGETAGDRTGGSPLAISISADGSAVAIGAYANDGNGSYAGHVRIYSWNGGGWVQSGSDIDGKAANDFFGWSVDISNDGSLVAVGSLGNDDSGTSAGQVRLFKLINGGWAQVGNDLNGEAAGDESGRAISLSGDGNTVAIGAYRNDATLGASGNEGHVRVYSLDSTKPTVAISSSTNSPSGNKSFPVAFTLSESSTDFGVDDIDVTNGTLSSFMGSGINYTATITALTDGVVLLDIAANNFTDVAGLQNEAATTFNLTYQRNAWDGETSTDWMVATNWSLDLVPSNTDDIIIPATANDPMISSDIEINSIDIETGANVTIASNSLKVNNETILNGSMAIMSGASYIPMGTVTGSGSANINRNTTFGITDGRYSIVGSSITSGSTNSLGGIIYSYDETVAYDPGGTNGSARFMKVTTPETMAVGNAYFSANTGDIMFSGVPNSGNVNVNLIYDETNDGGVTNAGFNLVSNPYTAAISYDNFIAGNTDIDGTIYLWDDGGSNLSARTNSDYITANSMGAASGGSSRAGDWDGYIRSTQGFFVKATTAGILHFTPSMMDIANNSDAGYFREATPTVLKFTLSSTKQYNEILIGFTDDATKGFDRSLDAYKIKGNSGLQLYSKMGESNLAIQALPTIDQETTIDLGFDASEAGIYTLQLKDASSYGFETYLKDHKLNELIDLSEINEYSFKTDYANNSDRFSLVFSIGKILAIEDQLLTDNMVIFSDANSLNVRLDNEISDATVSIYNLNGTLVKQVEHIDFKGMDWTTKFNQEGLFIMAIQSKDQLIVKKFMK